eukprot:13131721-Ditylum_brightwellii.AAC.1
MKNVRLDHQPCFIIVISEWPWSLSVMAPSAHKEWTPTSVYSPTCKRKKNAIKAKSAAACAW